ncbi:dynactin subunit 6 isoform X1 [Balaenoptera acutorostrata]|uniref:Dynactin subunit 6 n=1 Tax=Balaenoptera acutorostrata TaxID=9767 RepID=A0A383ZGA5_BALAC|nr:dynactin subunit 6 isoform X1 [Balaenoptera acutorostrata]
MAEKTQKRNLPSEVLCQLCSLRLMHSCYPDVSLCPCTLEPLFLESVFVKIAPGAVVCVESEIRGDVTIGPRTVIHPKARIIAEAGPIVIGEGNLIEEQALIINAHPENITPDAEDPEPKPMIIGTNNVFEVGCYSQAMKIGDNNVIESKAYVGRNVILTSGCIIGACCSLNTCEVIPENTVIYGTGCLRRVQTERPQPQTLQLDFLMKILPNYHHLKKTMKGSSTPVKN